MENYILEMSGISKSFYGVQVLDNAQIQVKPGEVHVLLGENGAGKSTLIKILSGAYRRETGEIKLNGEPLKAQTPKEIIDEGISVIYQEFNLNPYVPIYENIFLGKEAMKNGVINTKKLIEESTRYMEMIGLDVDPRLLVGELSVAQKQMVEIAKAISADVKILVLDEPTAAITDKETACLFEIVRNLKAKGIGIIYISHRMSELFEIGDRCTVMRDGKYVQTVKLGDTNVAELTKMMVGRDVDFSRMQNPHKQEETVLEVSGIYYKNLLKNVGFELNRGEILGISGLVGAGRTELAKCIIGALKRSAGKVVMNGEEIKPDIAKAISKGIVYLSEDRKDEGLILMHTVVDNIALPNLSKFGNFVVDNRKMIKVAEELVEKLHIKTTSCLSDVNHLSGGNQQKVVIAKWLCTNAQIYIFDEPTRGIDVGARDEIYNIMLELTQNGASIILISSDLTEVQKMSDRILIMREGQISAIIDNDDELTQDAILSYALVGGKVS